MAKAQVTLRTGKVITIEGAHSLMEAIRAAGIDEVLAICGGCPACGTCHVYVDDSYLDTLPPVGPDEEMILSGTVHKRSNSRLSCQIPLGERADTIKVTVAPPD